MKARVTVTLKPGILDPQGKAIEGALVSLGIEGVEGVRQGKVFDLDLATDDATEAEATLRSACERLLANTVIEQFRIDVEGAGASGKRNRKKVEEVAARPGPASDPTLDAAEHAEMPVEGHP